MPVASTNGLGPDDKRLPKRKYSNPLFFLPQKTSIASPRCAWSHLGHGIPWRIRYFVVKVMSD